MISYKERVISLGAGGRDVYVLPTSAADIVTFRGSFVTLPDMRSDEDLLQELVVDVLDKGTKRHDQFEIAEQLDNLGAQISFYGDGIRVGFRGRCLKQDVDTVTALVAEQLREPALDEAEIIKAQTRLIASAQRSLESTSEQASGALRRSVFPHDHPNYAISPEEAIRFYRSVDVESVRAYHAAHFGSRRLNTVFVGDVEPARIDRTVTAVFDGWNAPEGADSFGRDALAPAGGLSFVAMPDKPNADISMGHGLPLRRDDPRFVRLYVANFVLGGNFSARLMSRVRNELGLTYGIRSGIVDVDVAFDGLWEVSVTLSTENLERGIEATRAELDEFVASGITAEELAEKKTTITGSFKVGLATTAGLARTLLSNIERGFGPDYLDRFPLEVEECTLDGTNEVISQLLHPQDMHIAVAGARSPELMSENV